MKVAIRVDASLEIGFGHLSRCLTLAHALKAHSHAVYFLSGKEAGFKSIEENGFELLKLENPVDEKTDATQTLAALKTIADKVNLLIVDHYELGEVWENEIKKSATKTLAFEDVPNRRHEVDILFVQNELLDETTSPYRSLTPETCSLFLGPKFALLRPEFEKARSQLKLKPEKVSKVLVYFGTDITDETLKTLHAISALNAPNIEWHILLHSSYPKLNTAQALITQTKNTFLHLAVSDMASFMKDFDLSIGAGGFTVFERMCLGIPSLCISIADNQSEVLERFHKSGLLIYLGESAKLTSHDIAKSLQHSLTSFHEVSKTAQTSLQWVDGLGASRLVTELEQK